MHIQFWLAEAATDDRIILKLITGMYMQLADNVQDPSGKLTVKILKERPTS